MLIGNSETNGSESSNNIKDVTSDNFMEEVIELSKTTPVIVDFWAPWCGPCKELGPNIEKAVKNANGKVVLAKVNIDENQAIAAQLRVQSIPTVYAFVDGQPVDGFMGAQPESAINDFVKKISDLNKAGPNIEEMIEKNPKNKEVVVSKLGRRKIPFLLTFLPSLETTSSTSSKRSRFSFSSDI